MLQQNPYSINPRAVLFLKAAIALLTVFYLVNCFTPLRLCVDTVRYFGIKDCIEFGCPPDSDAAKDYMPYGYTALLLALSKLGILRSFSIVFINCIYLFAGLYLVKKMFFSSAGAWFMPVLVLLNWTIIKFVTHPLSEMQYLFFSFCSLYFFWQYTKTKKISSLGLAFAAGLLAFVTRTVGITLFAALVAGLGWEFRSQLIVVLKKNRLLAGIVLILAIGVVVFSQQLGLNHYRGVMSNQFQKGLTRTSIIGWHFTEWGEVIMNVSIVKVIHYFPANTGQAFFTIIGVLCFLVFLYILLLRKNKIPVIIKFYLVFYSLLMFNWPFYDPRFWVPVLPLIIMVAVQAFWEIRNKAWKTIRVLFLLAYIFSGAAAIGYLTYTSLHKETFARSQANGAYRNEYETRFFGKPQSDTARKIDPFVTEILKRYD